MTFAIDIDLDQVAEVVFDRLLHWKVLLYGSPLLPVLFGRKSHCTVFTEGGGIVHHHFRTE